MRDRSPLLDKGESPWAVLGVAESASEEEIRAAYLARIKQFPPDREPAQFEKIRDAKALLDNPRIRARQLVRGIRPDVPLAELLDASPPARHPVEVRDWVRVLESEEDRS